MTGFTKCVTMDNMPKNIVMMQELKSNLYTYHESHSSTIDRATDNQVCFHRQHFADPVNS